MTSKKCAKYNNKVSLAEATKKPDVIYVEEIEAPVEPPPPPPPQAPKEYKVYTYKTTTPKDETPSEEVPQTDFNPFKYKTIPPPVEDEPPTPKPLSGDLVYQSEPSEQVKIFKFEPHDAKPNKYFKTTPTATLPPIKLSDSPSYEPKVVSSSPAKLEEPFYFSVPTTATIYQGQEIFPEDVTNTLSEFDAVVASDGKFDLTYSHGPLLINAY